MVYSSVAPECENGAHVARVGSNLRLPEMEAAQGALTITGRTEVRFLLMFLLRDLCRLQFHDCVIIRTEK